MAAGPFAALALPALLARIAGGGGGMPGGLPGGGEAGVPPGQQISALSSELHGADPGMLLQGLQQIKSALSAYFIQASQRLPNVAGQLAMTMKQLDRAIKETQQAASTATVVRPPIGMSLASPTAATPGMGGGGIGESPMGFGL